MCMFFTCTFLCELLGCVCIDMCAGTRMNHLLLVLIKCPLFIESSSQLHHIIILITSSVVHYALVSNLYSHDPIMI